MVEPDSIERRVMLLAESLRRAGVAVAATELVDAFDATIAIGVDDRALWRCGLRAAMVKRGDQIAVFDDLFDRVFPTTRFRYRLPDPSASATSSVADAPTGNSDRTGLAGRVLDAIADGDVDALRQLAAEAVDAFAALESGASSERQYLMRVTKAMDLANLLQQALRRANGIDAGTLDQRLVQGETSKLVEEFRKLLASEITRRLAKLLPVETITTLKYPDDVEFLDTTIAQRAELRRAIAPLARKLASRMAQRRRLRRTGRIDVRRTVRHSLSFGGVPLEPVFKAKRASRPDLVVVCDVSGSVAEFAHFILSLVHALHEELQRLRTFVFVDGITEVTALFNTSKHEVVPMHLVTQPGVVRGDGHSDYGAVLDELLRDHVSALRPTSTAIVAGDARSNYRDARPRHAASHRGTGERPVLAQPRTGRSVVDSRQRHRPVPRALPSGVRGANNPPVGRGGVGDRRRLTVTSAATSAILQRPCPSRLGCRRSRFSLSSPPEGRTAIDCCSAVTVGGSP